MGMWSGLLAPAWTRQSKGKYACYALPEKATIKTCGNTIKLAIFEQTGLAKSRNGTRHISPVEAEW